MTVAIRKIAGTDRDYLAYARKFAGRATCFVYFQTTCGAPSRSTTSHLMLRLPWGHRPQLRFVEQDLSLKHPAVLELLRQRRYYAEQRDNDQLHPQPAPSAAIHLHLCDDDLPF